MAEDIRDFLLNGTFLPLNPRVKPLSSCSYGCYDPVDGYIQMQPIASIPAEFVVFSTLIAQVSIYYCDFSAICGEFDQN